MNKLFNLNMDEQSPAFQKLFDVSRKRTMLDALILYVFCSIGALVVLVLVGMLVSGILSHLAPQDLKTILLLVAGALTGCIVYVIIKAKNLHRQKAYLTITLISAVVSIFMGVFVGLLPIVYIAMRDKVIK